MGYVDQARRFAEHNVADWRAVGAKRILVLDPHDYISFTEDYPRYFGDDYDFEIVLVVELVAELIREGKLELTEPIDRVATYHDACRLNKRKGIHKEPREILRAIPGLTFKDVDHVTQWSYCSGAGAGLGIERPDLTAEISRRRVEQAKALEIDTLVSACVWSERPLTEQGEKQDVEVVDLMELVAAVGGDRGLRWRPRSADAVLDELVQICGEEHVFTGRSARFNRARVPSPFPGAPLGRVHSRTPSSSPPRPSRSPRS